MLFWWQSFCLSQLFGSDGLAELAKVSSMLIRLSEKVGVELRVGLVSVVRLSWLIGTDFGKTLDNRERSGSERI